MSLLASIFDWSEKPPLTEEVDAMLAAIPGRTPDGRHVARVPHGVLGYGARVVRKAERLALQPFRDDQRNLYGVGDIRLDNRDDLRKSLSATNLELDSDLAIVVAAYGQWGPQMAERLIGDFAFVIWNDARREVYAARDPFGVRSLVYYRSGSRLVLATEAAQFLPLQDFDRTPDAQVVVDFLAWSYGHYGPTFFRSARAVRPGHTLLANAEHLRETAYFRPPELVHYPRSADYEDEFRERFSVAVRDRLDSEYPIVAHLSGGLDSSSIVCLADRIYAKDSEGRPPFHLVSALFPGKAHDESAFIDAVGRQVAFRAHRWDGNIASGRDFSDPSLSFPGASVAFNGGSTGDLEIAGRLGARVILSGDPGDFVTGENGLFNELLVRGNWITLVRLILSGASAQERRIRRRLLRYAVREEAPLALAAWRAARFWQPGRPPIWLRPELAAMWSGPEFWSPPLLKVGINRLQQRIWDYQRWNRLSWAIDRLGSYAASGAAEMRFPLLDVRLVRFVLSVPVEHRLPGKLRRWLHRQSMAGIVPEVVRLRQSKPTFNRAVVDWGHCNLPAIRQMLEGPTWHSDAFVDRSKTRVVLEELAAKTPDRADREAWLGLRAIAHLETWLRAVFRYPRVQETPSMPDTRLAPLEPDSGSMSDAVPPQGYVAPELIPVGNVRDLLAADPGASDDGTPGVPALAGS